MDAALPLWLAMLILWIRKLLDHDSPVDWLNFLPISFINFILSSPHGPIVSTEIEQKYKLLSRFEFSLHVAAAPARRLVDATYDWHVVSAYVKS